MPRTKCSVYTIYSYTAPDGRKYIGKTSLLRHYRSGRHGEGYKSCSRFWNAIVTFGWSNFRYDVLATIDKTEIAAEEKACLLESYYISRYRTADERFGFNVHRFDSLRDYSKQAESRKNYKVIHKGDVIRQVPASNLDAYLEDGWEPGWIKLS